MSKQGETPAEDGGRPPPQGHGGGPAGKASVRRAVSALNRVCSRLPHLSGLAAVIELRFTFRHTQTACVTPSGLILVNPDWFNQLTEEDAAFVMAHELMHLALEHHSRGEMEDPKLVNIAGDYIINDLLTEELGYGPPEGGLVMPGARNLSVELMILDLRKRALENPRGMNSLGQALERSEEESLSGGVAPTDVLSGDLIDGNIESKWFPDEAPKRQRRMERVRRKIEDIAPLRSTLERMERLMRLGSGGGDRWADSIEVSTFAAAKTSYVPPWQLALQESLESLLPPSRSYARASRRQGGLASDIALPGRIRPPSFTLVIVIDTSGSMLQTIPAILGVIASFCHSAGVAQVRIVQCDNVVTVDEWMSPDELGSYEVQGFGGSDMSPAMEMLARDPEVQAAVVITDGVIDYPESAMPYEVIWAGTGYPGYFQPPYGIVLEIDPRIL